MISSPILPPLLGRGLHGRRDDDFLNDRQVRREARRAVAVGLGFLRPRRSRLRRRRADDTLVELIFQ